MKELKTKEEIKENEEQTYGYYSLVLSKPFKTLKELKEAENEYHLEQKAKEDKVAQRKERANEVQGAYKELIETRKKAYKEISDAEEKYYTLRNKFVDDYGSYHMSYTNDNGNEVFSTDTMSFAEKLIKELFNL